MRNAMVSAIAATPCKRNKRMGAALKRLRKKRRGANGVRSKFVPHLREAKPYGFACTFDTGIPQ